MDHPDLPLAGPSRLSPSRSPSPLSPRRKRRIITLSSDSESAHPPPLLGGGRPRKRPPTDQCRRRITRAQARRASSPSITTDLETIAAEDLSVKAEIVRLGLGLRDVQGDGNCLFRALADQLWGVQKQHVEVRKLVCDYLETNREAMEVFVLAFMKDGEGYEGYIERMRQLKTFGSHIEIQAAARVFRRSIRVVMSTTSFTIPWESEFPSQPTYVPSSPIDETHARRRTRSSTTNLLSTPAAPPPSSPSYATALAEYIPPIRPGRSMLWLALFSRAEHFQSVRKKGDGDSGAAEVEDRLAIPHEKDSSEAARSQRGEVVKGPSRTTQHGSVDQLLASLPPHHGVSRDQASNVLERVKGDIGEAVEILLEEVEEVGSDGRVDEMLAFRTTSPAETISSGSERGTGGGSGESKVTTPSAGEVETEKGPELEGMKGLGMVSSSAGMTGRAEGMGTGEIG